MNEIIDDLVEKRDETEAAIGGRTRRIAELEGEIAGLRSANKADENKVDQLEAAIGVLGGRAKRKSLLGRGRTAS